MAITAPPDTPELPDPPSTSSPADFDYRADAFLAALPTFKTSLESIADNAYDNATEAYGQANTASTYATNAAASATSASGFASAAAAASGATQWVSGSYATGAVAWSPADGKVYRRKAPGGSSPTDPSNDLTNWFALAASQTPPVVTLTASTTVPDGTRSVRFVVVTDGITITLPPNPQAGDSIGVIDKSGAASPTMTIARNGKNIESLAENLSVNYQQASFALTYFDATRGWVVTAYQNLDGTVVFPSGAFVDTTSTQTLSGKTLAAPTITGTALFTSGAFGYGTGAGWQGTQATSKNTTVTVTPARPSGQITMNSSALAAGASAFFQVNNAAVAANDTVTVQPVSFSASYRVESSAGNAGVFYVRVTNITGGSLSDAVALQFNAIKGATA